MKQGLLVLVLTVLTGAAQAAESRVYLMALANLGGSNLAQVVFLHEPEITQLEVCEEARLKGIRERDWLRYHHIFMSHQMKGFTVQRQYRCVLNDQPIDSWYDKAKYDYAYLIKVDPDARLHVQQMSSMAHCTGALEKMPQEEREQSHCAKANQKLLAKQ
jgi:hypothetical protein